MHASTAAPSSGLMARTISSARGEPRAKWSAASNSIDDGASLPSVKISSVASGTRCRNSHASFVTTRTPSHSLTMYTGASYAYLIHWPSGPTMSTILSQYSTTLSVPHHTSCSGGTRLRVLNDAISVRKSAVTTHSTPARVKHATKLPSCDTHMRVNGPLLTSMSCAASPSTTSTVPVFVATSTSACADAVCRGSTTHHDAGGASRRGSASARVRAASPKPAAATKRSLLVRPTTPSACTRASSRPPSSRTSRPSENSLSSSPNTLYTSTAPSLSTTTTCSAAFHPSTSIDADVLRCVNVCMCTPLLVYTRISSAPLPAVARSRRTARAASRAIAIGPPCSAPAHRILAKSTSPRHAIAYTSFLR
mmetsp:Transcript_6827/g.16502  ORF Transcript_6827/g.16502 Transcript_6827/m.16502 type:complete len:365 (-) Transcript_6827:149-1243(-)